MRSLRVLGLFLAAALLFVPAQAGAAKPQAKNVRQTAGPIRAVAMDGSRVAYMASDRRVAVWNVATGKTTVIKGAYPR